MSTTVGYGPDKSSLWSEGKPEPSRRISFEKVVGDAPRVDNAKRGSTNTKRSEPPLRIDTSKMAGPVHVDKTGRVATGGQGRSYWNVMTQPPTVPITPN